MHFLTFILQTIAWLPTRIFFNYFTHLTVKGQENLDTVKEKGVIFAMNHSSELDPIIFTATLNPFSKFMPMYYVSRESSFYKKNTILKKIIYREWFFKLWGAYKAEIGIKDYDTSLSRHVEILKNGGSICIFPEGKKTKDGTLSLAKGGVVHLAKSSNKTIVPVAINGIFKMSFNKFFERKIKIVVTFGKPIHISELLNGNGDNSSLHYGFIANEKVLRPIAQLYNAEKAKK